MRTRRAPLHLVLATTLVTGAVTTVGVAAASPHAAGARPAAQTASAATATARAGALLVRGSARQVDVTGLPGHASAELLRGRRVVATGKADPQGGLLFRNVAPGAGYRVHVLPHGTRSAAVTVHTDAAKPWDPSVYQQSVPDDGYGYLTTRDGTKLAYTVHPPTSPAGLGGTAPPPGAVYPTLIEYSGYGYAAPKSPVNGIAVLANLMGFAVVDVSMRGTGCSAGAYDFFEPLQSLDGYDVIQTIARQPWVKDHKVGMMGISYGAISQLFTAQYHPPALEAISPLSTIDATASTLYPGGILNDGFAVAWAKERQDQAQVAGKPGAQPYAEEQIKAGDTVCKANQALHGEAADLMAKIRANSHYHPKVADPLDPVSFVHKIHVPVFMACQFEDEQTGGHCPTLAEHMTGTTKKWFTFTNGAHIDSLDPATFNRWYDFLSLYVAHQAPAQNAATIRAAAPVIYQMAMGLPSDDSVTLPADPIQTDPSYTSAKASFDALPQVRVLFDNGAGAAPAGGTTAAGNPYDGFEESYARFPVPHTVAQRWYLGQHGTLRGAVARTAGIDGYTSNADALPRNDFGPNTGGGGLWGNASQWDYRWKQHRHGTALSYLSAPLRSDTTVVGAGAVTAWVRSSAPDVDLMATVTEVSPDGHETFVQNGYLRASERRLDRSRHSVFAQPSSTLQPVPSMRPGDVRPMPRGRFVKLTIPLYYEGHAYRKGTRIRVTISAPNGTQPIWSFAHTVPTGTAKVALAFSRSMPSSLVLPVVPGGPIPTAQPACPSLRNEPCRAYKALANRKVRH